MKLAIVAVLVAITVAARADIIDKVVVVSCHDKTAAERLQCTCEEAKRLSADFDDYFSKATKADKISLTLLQIRTKTLVSEACSRSTDQTKK